MSSVPAGRETGVGDARVSPRAGCNVLIVDDCAVLRRLLRDALEKDPDITVTGTAKNGQEAVEAARRLEADVVVLDVEMPVMDGLTALPLIRGAAPNAQILMASRLTQRNAQISMKALAAGATDYLAKPSSIGDGMTAADFNSELVRKVKALGHLARVTRERRSARADAPSKSGRAGQPSDRPAKGIGTAREPRAAAERQPPGEAFTLRPAPVVFRPKVIAIGSSTGGPQALMRLVADLAAYTVTVPIVVTQHMPPMFTQILAEQIAAKQTIDAQEASDGQTLQPGRLYVAPGGKHLLIEQANGALKAVLDDGPPVQFCKPALDPMLESLIGSVGAKHVLSVILTGMGQDGLDGARAVVEQGGVLLAQDEETSVVWGMPGAVATAGLCQAVLPLGGIADEIARYAGFAAVAADRRRNIA